MSFGSPVRNGLGIGLTPSTALSSGRVGGRPAMFLNFVGATALSSNVTFTRSTTATFTGSNGLIQTAAINEPRFDYDPVTLAAKGLLIEEQRANLLLRSEEFDNASWTKSNATVTANATTAPDGTTAADKLVEDTATSQHYVSQGITTATATYTISIYAKAAGRTKFQTSSNNGTIPGATFDLAAVTATPVGTTSAATITAVGNGWYRCTATRSVTGAADATLIRLLDNAGNTSYTGDGTSGIYIWAAQLEAGSFATSYIPTVASQVTRTADVATMTGTNFSSWYNASEGTLVAVASTFKPTTTASSAVITEVNDGTLANRNVLQYQSNLANARTVAAATIVSDITQAYTANAVDSLAYAFKTNDFAFCRNGVIVGTDVSGLNPTVDRLMIGSFSSNTAPLNGHIRSIQYYNTRLPNATLQALTA